MNKFRKEQVNTKLKALGWEIPRGIAYQGMLNTTPVRCIKCGWVQEKRLDNLIYREEECPSCGQGIFEESLEASVAELRTAVAQLAFEFKEAVKKLADNYTRPVAEAPEIKQDTTNLKALYRRYIAKAGIKSKGRKLMSDEWHKLSHDLSEEIMLELAENVEQFHQWETFYTDLLSEHPTKQGQDLLLAVIPASLHGKFKDAIAKRLVKL